MQLKATTFTETSIDSSSDIQQKSAFLSQLASTSKFNEENNSDQATEKCKEPFNIESYTLKNVDLNEAVDALLKKSKDNGDSKVIKRR